MRAENAVSVVGKYRKSSMRNLYHVPVSLPCPYRVPDTIKTTVSPCPHPFKGGHGSDTVLMHSGTGNCVPNQNRGFQTMTEPQPFPTRQEGGRGPSTAIPRGRQASPHPSQGISCQFFRGQVKAMGNLLLCARPKETISRFDYMISI